MELSAACVPQLDPTDGLLLLYQETWLSDKSRVKVVEKSRRVGITWATAADCVLEAAAGLQDTWYIAYSEDGAKEFIRDAAQWALELGIAAGAIGEVILYADDDDKQEGVKALQIAFPAGKRITALTSSPRNLRGKQGRVVIDEAAFHDNLAELLKAAFALLMWGGEVWIMSTHNGADNPFALLCDDVRDGKLNYSLHRITITDALEQGLYKRICLKMQIPWSRELEAKWLADLEADMGDGASEELHCEPAKAGTAYIGRSLIDAAMYTAPVLRCEWKDDELPATEELRQAAMLEWIEAELDPLLKVAPDMPHAFGLDFGRYADLTVMCPLTIGQDLVKRAQFMVELRNIPFNQQWQVCERIMRRLPRLTHSCFDAGGNGSWVAEQAWMTFGGDDYVDMCQLSHKEYKDRMPPLKQAHESGLIKYPRDADVRADVSQIRRVNGVPMLSKLKNEGTATKGKRHGDAAIALMMAHSAASKAEEMHLRWSALSTL